MKVFSLDDLLIDQLKDIYDAERRLARALTRMREAALSAELSTALGDHLASTEEHLSRLEWVFGALHLKPGSKTCEAMLGMLAAGERYIRGGARGVARDAALIAAAQKVKHYQIATYGCLQDWTEKLGHTAASDILQRTLVEESAADRRLTAIAQSLDVEAIRSTAAARRDDGGKGMERRGGGGPESSRFARQTPAMW